MTRLLTTAALSLALASASQAQSVAVALDTNPDRDQSGTYRYVDNLIQNLEGQGWDTETFPRDTIGGEDERLDQIRAGILDVSMSNYAVATQFVPEMRVLQLPYMFEDPAAQFEFFGKTDYLDTVNEQLAPEGMRILAVVPNGGFLGIFNNKREVRSVEDMAGLRMRALDPSQLEMFSMMGANGVVIPFAEVPNAIQTGIADGYVNAPLVAISFGQAELFSHFTDAKVVMSARLALASTSWWDGLSEEEQAQFQQASSDALQEVFNWVDVSDTEHKEMLAEAGIAVYEPTPEELATFRDATLKMSETIPEVSPERVSELRAMAAGQAQ